MELKPIKEIKEVNYPTLSNSKKTNFLKNMLLAATAIRPQDMIMYVATPMYVAEPSYMIPLKICKLVRNVTIITAILSLILLIRNKIKIKKSINESGVEEKLKKINKHIKINWIFLVLSIIIMIGAIIFMKVIEG